MIAMATELVICGVLVPIVLRALSVPTPLIVPLVETFAFGAEWFASGSGAPVLAFDVVAGVAVGVVVVDVRFDRMPRRYLCHVSSPCLHGTPNRGSPLRPASADVGCANLESGPAVLASFCPDQVFRFQSWILEPCDFFGCGHLPSLRGRAGVSFLA